MKRPILYWVILFILGALYYKIFSLYVIGFIIISFLLTFMKKYCPNKKWLLWTAGGVCFLLGFFCMYMWERQRLVCEMYDTKVVSFEGVVLKKETKYEKERYTVFLKRLNDKQISMKVQMQVEPSIILGSTIAGKGILCLFEKATNYGAFDARAYQYGNGVMACIEKVELHNRQLPVIPLREKLCQIRKKIETIYYMLFPDAHAALASAMVLGIKENMDKEIKAMYQENGIAHLIAISGLHIAMIGGTLYHFLRKMVGSYKVAALVGGTFIILYGILSGLSGATCRAIVMLLVSIGADVAGRRYDGLTAMSLALFVMIIWNPYQITQAGFLLSFGAVCGIIFIKPLWKMYFPRLSFLSEGLSVSFSVQLVITPVLLWFFYEIPLYGVLLNLVVVPLMNYLLAFLILCGILGVCFVEVAGVLAFLPDWIFGFYEMLCKITEFFPFHTVCFGRPHWTWVVFYYAFLILAIHFFYQKERLRGMLSIALLGISFFAFVLPGNLCIRLLDVGQGDCIYIETQHHQHILVDGGSSTKRNVGDYVIKSTLKYHGCIILDYVFVTHSDIDHYSGIKELLEANEIAIRHLVLPNITNPDEAYMELVLLAQQKGCDIDYIKMGDEVYVDRVRLACLNPKKQDYEEKNDSSIVLHLNYTDFDMLLTGDLTMYGEDCVAKQIKGNVEVLKVAHHGSATSTSEQFLRALSPDVACISVGENNTYGHPSLDVMKRLEKHVSKIYLTKHSGTITIETDGKTYWIDEYCSKQ